MNSSTVEGREIERLEALLTRAAKRVAYPATPSLSRRIRAALEAERSLQRVRFLRPAIALTIAILAALALLIAFPETREALAQILGLRTIQIIPAAPTATGQPGLVLPTAATPLPNTLTVTPARRSQCCETSLADALARSKFKILLPPPQTPSHVYLQLTPIFGTNAQQVILVYGDATNPRFVLYQATNVMYLKIARGGTLISETQVKGQRALWLTGAPHLLVYLDASGRVQFDAERIVNLNMLGWEVGDITYRIETPLSREEAIRFAESLQ